MSFLDMDKGEVPQDPGAEGRVRLAALEYKLNTEKELSDEEKEKISTEVKELKERLGYKE